MDKNDIIKPPLGIMPKKLHREQRFIALYEAISRYLSVGNIEIPLEWVEEYNELLYSIHGGRL